MLRECKVAEPEEATGTCEQHPGVVRSEQNSGGLWLTSLRSPGYVRQEPATLHHEFRGG